MPQIWLTYDEAGNLFGCDAAGARERAIVSGYDRRKCHDGKTRIKLSLSAAHDYMVSYASGIQAIASTDQRLMARETDLALN